MMGGVGFVKSSPVEKFYRDSKIGELTSYHPNTILDNVTPSFVILTLALGEVWKGVIPFAPLLYHCVCPSVGQIYEGPSFIQLNTIAKCMDKEYFDSL